MKRLILLVLMLVPLLCPAQEKDVAIFQMKRDGEKERLQLRPFDYTSTEQMTFSVKTEEEGMSIKKTQVMKDNLIYHLKGKKSKNSFKRELTFRIYFNEGSAYNIDHIYIGSFDLQGGERRIVQQKPDGDEIHYPEDARLPSPQGRFHEIAEDVYEITVSGLRGEYYIMLIDPETGRYHVVYDFRLR